MRLNMSYCRAATLAADVERAENYQHAATLWREAACHTANSRNQEWCDHRAAVCQRLHKLRKEDQDAR